MRTENLLTNTKERPDYWNYLLSRAVMYWWDSVGGVLPTANQNLVAKVIRSKVDLVIVFTSP